MKSLHRRALNFSLHSLLEANFSFLGRLLNFSSGIIGKRPFLAKSWPGAFAHRSCSTKKSLHRYIAFIHRRVYTQKAFHKEASLHKVKSFFTQQLLHAKAFTQRSLQPEELLHREAYTQKLLHKSVYTQQAFTHTGAFTQRSPYTKELFTHRRFYTEKSLP